MFAQVLEQFGAECGRRFLERVRREAKKSGNFFLDQSSTSRAKRPRPGPRLRFPAQRGPVERPPHLFKLAGEQAAKQHGRRSRYKSPPLCRIVRRCASNSPRKDGRGKSPCSARMGSARARGSRARCDHGVAQAASDSPDSWRDRRALVGQPSNRGAQRDPAECW